MSAPTTASPSRPDADAPAEVSRRPRHRRMRGRPMLYTRYQDDQAPLGTPAKRLWLAVLLAGLLVAPAMVGREWESLLTLTFVYGIGAIGLNLVTGYAGQVSLGHAFFLGLGAYTAAVFGGSSAGGLVGFGLDIWVWLPMAGIIPALVGLAVGPIATRVRGLYLAIVTLGLVFIGEHVFREARSITGGLGTGRAAAQPIAFGFSFNRPSEVAGFTIDGSTKFYLLCLVLLIVFAVVSKNLARSKIGRAFAAVRDRDIAAEIMGVPLTRTKVIAFTISSFYAGICGALLGIATGGFIEPSFYGLLLSVNFLAMILIGGVSTLSGSLVGAAFVTLLPRLVQGLPDLLPGGLIQESSTLGRGLNVLQVEAILFGALIVVFLVVEPRGLYGVWVRIRNYWKAFPFSY